MISKRLYKTFFNKLYKSKALQNKSFLISQQKKDSIEQNNLMLSLNKIICNRNDLHIQFTKFKKDFENKNNYEAVQSLQSEFITKSEILNKKEAELKEKIKEEKVSKKTILNNNLYVREQSFTNNFIKRKLLSCI